MAKYDVKFSCGHTGRVELFGKTIDREKKIYYYENFGCCAECKKQEKDKLIAEAEEEFNLPKIEGVSEKQIAYARNLRADFCKRNPKLIAQFRKEWQAYKGDFDKLITTFNNKPHSAASRAYVACIVTDAAKIIDIFK